MAFKIYASAQVATPDVKPHGYWSRVRTASLGQNSSFNLRAFSPRDYLFSHCTIIASVDTEPWCDHYITKSTEQYINGNCFPGDTRILMADGTTKFIKDIEIGDLVITHDGTSKPVTRLYERYYSGNLVEISPTGVGLKVLATPEHPFSSYKFTNYGTGRGKKGKREFNWSEASSLKKRDVLRSPIIKGDIKDPDVTPGKARLLGLYLGDGYVENRPLYRRYPNETEENYPYSVQFSFSIQEENVALLCQKLLSDEFGLGSTLYYNINDNVIIVNVNKSPKTAEWFIKHAGQYVKQKKLHSSVLLWPVDIQRYLLMGLLESDGSVFTAKSRKNDIRGSVSLSNREVIEQCYQIAKRVGINARLFFHVGTGAELVRTSGKLSGKTFYDNDSYQINIQQGYLEDLMRDSTYSFKVVTKRNFVRYLADQDFTYHSVRNIKEVPFSDKVYNIEVEDNHTYVANGVLVHNCDSWTRGVLKKTYKTFIGAENYVEHVQVPALSKGKIVDAVLREVNNDTLYTDILVATHKKHRDLINKIRVGSYNAMSMGCIAAYTICTKCGNLAADESGLCICVRANKGQYFQDKYGNVRMIAELCLPWDNKVLMADGEYKYIDEVNVGDMVITHKGSGRKVTKTFRKDFVGNLINIKIEGGINNIRSTYNHPHYVYDKITGELSFKEAKDIKVGDFLVKQAPRISKSRDSARRSFGITADTAWVIGLYAAEGYYDDSSRLNYEVRFTLNGNDEMDIADKIKEIIERDFEDSKVKIYHYERSEMEKNVGHLIKDFNNSTRAVIASAKKLSVVVESKDFWYFVKKHCSGKRAWEKSLSSKLLKSPLSIQRKLLEGWLTGDGSIDEQGRVRGYTTSEKLFHDFEIIATRLNIWNRGQVIFNDKKTTLSALRSINRNIEEVKDDRNWRASFQLYLSPKDVYDLSVNSDLSDKQFSNFLGDCRKIEISKPRGQHNGEKYNLHKVVSIESEPYVGEVFNLEVEEDHSYIIDGIVTHNCGHESDSSSVRFIEASWVAQPAFPGAVLRNVLNQEQDTIYLSYAANPGYSSVQSLVKGMPVTASLGGGRLLFAEEDKKKKDPAEEEAGLDYFMEDEDQSEDPSDAEQESGDEVSSDDPFADLDLSGEVDDGLGSLDEEEEDPPYKPAPANKSNMSGIFFAEPLDDDEEEFDWDQYLEELNKQQLPGPAIMEETIIKSHLKRNRRFDYL